MEIDPSFLLQDETKAQFAPRQLEFILNSQAKINLASGPMRSGKTVGVLFRFMQAVASCPGEGIWMIGYNLDNVFHNCVSIMMNDSPTNPLSCFSKYITWQSSGIMHFMGKKVYCVGASDERAVGKIQGKTFDLCYCNEMTLYPESVIETITTRLSMPHAIMFADMNPVQPSHKCKQWIDLAAAGDKNYYSLSFSIDDNPFLLESFKKMLKQTLTGLFYRRNYLGEWCLADGAIFNFFDKKIHVNQFKKGCDFWIAGVDYGASNAFACVIIGVKNKKYGNDTAYMQVQHEYYWDHKRRQKTNSELCRDLLNVFDKYPVKAVYLDPSAASFRSELRANGITTKDTNNDVVPGITLMTSMVNEGQVSIHESCVNLIREIEGYCWDPKISAKGKDEPIKQNDHAIDALRYALMGHMGGENGPRTQFGIVNDPNDPNFGRTLGHNLVDSGQFQGHSPRFPTQMR